MTAPEEVHRKIAAAQIVDGIRNVGSYYGCWTLPMIPKDAEFTGKWTSGTQAWGIHAVQGWYLWKIMSWVGFLSAVGLVFVVLWLALVSSTDLQNAFVPFTFLSTMILVALALPQYTGVA